MFQKVKINHFNFSQLVKSLRLVQDEEVDVDSLQNRFGSFQRSCLSPPRKIKGAINADNCRLGARGAIPIIRHRND